MGNIFTTTCNGVCPELTTSEGEALFTLVGDTTLRGVTLAFFEAPGSYQGGTVTWSIESALGNAPPLASGSVNMTQWDIGAVNINGIPLEEYYENFNIGSGISGVSLVAGTYYLDISDHSTPPDHFGIFWATNSTGLAFAMEGTGDQPTIQVLSGVPEPSTWALTAAGLGAILFGAGNSASERRAPRSLRRAALYPVSSTRTCTGPRARRQHMLFAVQHERLRRARKPPICECHSGLPVAASRPRCSGRRSTEQHAAGSREQSHAAALDLMPPDHLTGLVVDRVEDTCPSTDSPPPPVPPRPIEPRGSGSIR